MAPLSIHCKKMLNESVYIFGVMTPQLSWMDGGWTLAAEEVSGFN